MSTPRKMTPEEWEEARARWETDPRDGYAWLKRELNLPVSEVAILKRARKELWAKKASMKTVAELAQFKADQKAAKADKLLSEAESVDIRARILETHRREWQEHRERFPLDAIITMIDGDPAKSALTKNGEKIARAAKIVAETIKHRQAGEREAWGLDAIATDTTAGVKTIEELEAMYAAAMRRSDEMQLAVEKERGRLDAVDR